MESTKNYKSEINIKDLILAVMKKLGVMIIVGAVLGGVLGSYKVFKRVKTNDVLDARTKLSDSETDVQYELRVQNINKARVYAEMIDNLNLQIDNQRDYIANSIYMQIDAENVYQSTAQITLTLQNNDTNGIDSALFGAYEREVKAGNYLDQYAKQINKKPDYIKELISFSSSAAGNTIISMDNNVNRVGSMYISVVGPSREFCDEVMDLVISKVQSVYNDLNTSVSPHTISLVGVQQIQKIDNSIRDSQLSHTGTINSLQNQITSYNDQLDKVAKELDLADKEAILEYFEEHPDVKIYGIPNEQLTIKNGNFMTNSFESESMSGRLYNAPNKGMYYNRGLLFNECCNVSVSNVNHTITNDTLSGTYYGFLDFNTCANAEIDNCNLFARKYNGGGRSTYDLVIDKCVNIRCNNITTNDILAHDRWGFHKTQYAKDLTFENCNINNVDAHEGVCNLTIKNSKIGAKKVDVTGFGTMNIIDTEILGDALLGLRGDYGAFWDGDVNIINCTYTHNSEWAWVLFKSDLSFFEESNPFDFGYEIKMPNIYVENLTLNNENIPNEEKLLMFGIWNKELGKKIPADYWPERIYIKGVKFINNNSKNPHIELAPVELKNLKEDCVKIDI